MRQEYAARRPNRLMAAFTAVLAGLVLLFASVEARAVEPVFSRDGFAIRGYDPVAYFAEQEPVRGKSEHSLEWMGTTWLFASATNRDAFAAEPERYAPQYGGYCAWAVSQGSTAPIDPDAWAVHKGKLYLNYSKPVQWRWAFDKDGNIAKGDTNWPKIKAGG